MRHLNRFNEFEINETLMEKSQPKKYSGSAGEFYYKMYQFIKSFCEEKGNNLDVKESGVNYFEIVDNVSGKKSVVDVKLYGRNGIDIVSLKNILDRMSKAKRDTGSVKMILITNNTASSTLFNIGLLDSNYGIKYENLEVIGAETFRAIYTHYRLTMDDSDSYKNILSLLHMLESSGIRLGKNLLEDFYNQLDPNFYKK